MSKATCITILSFLLIMSSPSLRSILAVEYRVVNSVPNTPGGKRFNSEIGILFTLLTMKPITPFIWKTFKQNTDAQRKDVPILTCNITELSDDDAWGAAGVDAVYISESSIVKNFPPGLARIFFAGLLYHEMTHIFQWSGQGTAPSGLTEGIAEFVKFKAIPWFSYPNPGEGDRWDEGYGVTARFLEYCDSLRAGFTADLNNMMREVYMESYFNELLGKSVEQLWGDYKAKYGGKKSSSALNDDVMY